MKFNNSKYALSDRHHTPTSQRVIIDEDNVGISIICGKSAPNRNFIDHKHITDNEISSYKCTEPSSLFDKSEYYIQDYIPSTYQCKENKEQHYDISTKLYSFLTKYFEDQYIDDTIDRKKHLTKDYESQYIHLLSKLSNALISHHKETNDLHNLNSHKKNDTQTLKTDEIFLESRSNNPFEIKTNKLIEKDNEFLDGLLQDNLQEQIKYISSELNSIEPDKFDVELTFDKSIYYSLKINDLIIFVDFYPELIDKNQQVDDDEIIISVFKNKKKVFYKTGLVKSSINALKDFIAK